MPELPALVARKRYFDSTSLHQTVQAVDVGNPYVLQTSIGRGSDARALPSSYIVHHRGEAEDCPRCGTAIRRIKINQRNTYFCSECQERG